MEKEIMQIQLALFFQSDYTGSFEDFSLRLKNKLGESKITQHIPVPSDAPSEIPRLVLGYDTFNVNISKNRADLFSKDIETIKSIVGNVSEVVTDLSIHIGRLGLVKNFFVDGDIENLKNLLLKEKITGKNIKEINIRVNETKTIEEYECNNIERLSSGYVIKKEDEKEARKEGIIIARDINTLPEKIKQSSFNKEEINKLLDVFDKEINNFILID